MVAMQQCIALLPLPLILHGMCDKLVTVPLEPRIVWDIAIIRRRQGYHSFCRRTVVRPYSRPLCRAEALNGKGRPVVRRAGL